MGGPGLGAQAPAGSGPSTDDTAEAAEPEDAEAVLGGGRSGGSDATGPGTSNGRSGSMGGNESRARGGRSQGIGGRLRPPVGLCSAEPGIARARASPALTPSVQGSAWRANGPGLTEGRQGRSSAIPASISLRRWALREPRERLPTTGGGPMTPGRWFQRTSEPVVPRAQVSWLDMALWSVRLGSLRRHLGSWFRSMPDRCRVARRDRSQVPGGPKGRHEEDGEMQLVRRRTSYGTRMVGSTGK